MIRTALMRAKTTPRSLSSQPSFKEPLQCHGRHFQYQHYYHEDQGESYDVQDRAREVGIGLEPFAQGTGELEREPGSKHQGHKGECLGNESLGDSVVQCRHAAKQDDYVYDVHLVTY